MNWYLSKFQHKNASTGESVQEHVVGHETAVFNEVLILTIFPRGSVGMSGTGQWKAHRCSDELMDQTDGLPNNCCGPGTGELHCSVISHFVNPYI